MSLVKSNSTIDVMYFGYMRGVHVNAVLMAMSHIS